jgi:beta-glucosidase-like glycosyl hydrolase
MPLPTHGDPVRLLFPALRWSEESGFDHQKDEIEEALGLGVGGFILFGGEAAAVREVVADLRARARAPLLVGADLERGAGQQFGGCTSLPPAWALGSLGDLEALWRAGELTAREARALGVDWVYAPVADLGNEPANPIVATRALGADPRPAGRAVAAWTMGCLAGGALPCAKHFPGHGRTLTDSHVGLPVVTVDLATLARDLVPFAAAVAAGVPSIMSAHVAYPALDGDGRPATRSAPILTGLLRGRLGFRGVVVSDALIMEGAQDGGGEVEAAIEAVTAGVDALLYPQDTARLAAGLTRALGEKLSVGRVREATERLARMRRRIPPAPQRAAGVGEAPGWGTDEDRAWARETALRTIHPLREVGDALTWPFTLVTIDDDLGGAYPPPPRSTFVGTLRALGVEVEPEGEGNGDRPRQGSTLIALYADVRAWKGRVGLSAEASRRLREALSEPGPSLVVLFSHPWNGVEVPPGVPVLCAWGGEPIMQEAAARAVARLTSA